MPIYEYQCTDCQHEFDLIQKMNDPVTKVCPKCAKETAVRLVSAAGFQLKGTGWYSTDFKDKGKPQPKIDSDSAPKSEAAPAAQPSETKGGDK